MTTFIIILLMAFVIFACWKWLMYELTALAMKAFLKEKYREPTNEEIHYYAGVAIKKIFKINY